MLELREVGPTAASSQEPELSEVMPIDASWRSRYLRADNATSVSLSDGERRLLRGTVRLAPGYPLQHCCAKPAVAPGVDSHRGAAWSRGVEPYEGLTNQKPTLITTPLRRLALNSCRDWMALWRNSENPAISNPCRYLFAISQPGVYIYAKFSGRFADPLASPSLNVDREALWINRERGKQGITVGTGMRNPGIRSMHVPGVALVLILASNPLIRGRVDMHIRDVFNTKHIINMRVSVYR